MEETKKFIEEMHSVFKYILDQEPIKEVAKKERRSINLIEIVNEETGEVASGDMTKLLFDSALNMYRYNYHTGEVKFIEDTKGYIAKVKS
jgi:hypothetical protein